MKVVNARRARRSRPNIRAAVETQRQRGRFFCQVADYSQRSGVACTAVARGRRSAEAFVGDPSRTIAGARDAPRPDAMPVAHARTRSRQILTPTYLSDKFDLGNLLSQHRIDIGSLSRFIRFILNVGRGSSGVTN
jgi:hypothetical protein